MNGSGWTEQDKENENIRDNAAFNASHAVEQIEKEKRKKGEVPDPMEMYKLQKEMELCNMGNG